MSNEIEIAREFFLVVAGGSDDLVSVNWDGNEGFPTKDAAVEWAKDNAFDGSIYTLFRCVPVECVERGPVRVKPIAQPKKS